MNNYLIINTKQLPLTGCIKAKLSKKAKTGKYKLRISKGSTAFAYDISQKKYQVYPLQLGAGKYFICLYKNTIDTKYSLQQKIQVNIEQSKYYLHPNLYVNYLNLEDISNLAKQLKGQNKNNTIQSIKKYISQNYKYDKAKALQLKSKKGILPNIQECFNIKMGICQDLAALTTALFRLNDIPAKFIIGYIKDQYHAWTEYYDEQNQIWTLFDPTQAIFKTTTDIKNYQIERWY